MSRVIGDHPDIAAALATGHPRGYTPIKRKCPVCGAELAFDAKVYMNWREIIGCEHCIEAKNAEDVWEDE